MRLRLRRDRDPEGRMTLGEHLRELRRRTVISVLAILAGSIVGGKYYAASTTPSTPSATRPRRS